MAKTLKAGEKVAWETSHGTAHGTVKRKLTRPTQIKGHSVAASTDEPQYLVESQKTGGWAAHKPDALIRRS